MSPLPKPMREAKLACFGYSSGFLLPDELPRSAVVRNLALRTTQHPETGSSLLASGVQGWSREVRRNCRSAAGGSRVARPVRAFVSKVLSLGRTLLTGEKTGKHENHYPADH